MQLIDIYSQKYLYTIPILICAYIIWRKMTCKKKRTPLDEYSFQKPISKTNSRYIRKILKKLSLAYPDYCAVNVSNKEQFYLINDEYLIDYIQHDSSKLDGLFESQLKQPYLILNSECNQKLTVYEFETYVIPQLDNYFQDNKNYFVNKIISKEFEIFFKKTIKKFEIEKTIESKDIFELVFKISDSLLRRLFSNVIYDDETNTSGDKNRIFLMNNLYLMHQQFTLGLFTKLTNVEEYSQLFMDFLKLIDFEYQITLAKHTNSSKLKFLLIKTVYLDTMRIFSCLLWIINDAFKLNLDNNLVSSELIEQYLIKISMLDLYYLTKPSAQSTINLPGEFNFISNKNNLIVLNLFSVCEQPSEIKSNDFILTTVEHLVKHVLDRFRISRTRFFKSTDFGLINFNEIKLFEVELMN